MRVALIMLNVVVNTVDTDEIPADFYGYHLAIESDTARIGDLYVNGTFIAPEVIDTTPVVVTPPAATHKVKGLSRFEYIDLFTPTEQVLYFRFMDNMYGNLSFMPTGNVSLSDTASTIGSPLTYFQVMIIGKALFTLASPDNGFDIDNPKTIAGVTAMSLLGMLDSPARLSTILKGKPL